VEHQSDQYGRSALEVIDLHPGPGVEFVVVLMANLVVSRLAWGLGTQEDKSAWFWVSVVTSAASLVCGIAVAIRTRRPSIAVAVGSAVVAAAAVEFMVAVMSIGS
jgi:hypothetical protein